MDLLALEYFSFSVPGLLTDIWDVRSVQARKNLEISDISLSLMCPSAKLYLCYLNGYLIIENNYATEQIQIGMGTQCLALLAQLVTSC